MESIELQPIYCDREKGGCGGVVADGVKMRGILRPICPHCKHRVWVQSMKVIRIDKKPSSLPSRQTA